MRALLCAALLVAALAGCSDDDPDASTPTTGGEVEDGTLEADFTYEVELAEGGPTNCPVAQIRFRDTSDGEPTEWEWTFTNADGSTEQHPTVFHEVSEATLTIGRGDETDTVTHPVSYAVC